MSKAPSLLLSVLFSELLQPYSIDAEYDRQVSGPGTFPSINTSIVLMVFDHVGNGYGPFRKWLRIRLVFDCWEISFGVRNSCVNTFGWPEPGAASHARSALIFAR
jgi:hypothetical protein